MRIVSTITVAALAVGATAVGTGLAADRGGTGGFTVSAEQLRINQRISQAAVRRANANRDALAKMQDQATTPGPQGPAGPQGATGAAGSDARVNGVAAGGALSGTFPNPGLAAKAVDADAIGVPLAVTAAGTATSGPSGSNFAVALTENAEFGFDPAGMHDPADDRALTAPRAGIYRTSAVLRFDTNATGQREAIIRHEKAAGGADSVTVARAGAADDGWTIIGGGATLAMAAGDVVKIQAYHDGGGFLDVTAEFAELRFLGPAS